MASSFSSQIPLIIHLLSKLAPRSLLDIGKGFGKYGFLTHEYCGLDYTVRPDPHRTLAQQSRIVIDAVESNPDYLWPHLDHLYRHIYTGRIEALYKTLPHYDVVLMADVIEHLKKEDALAIVRHFVEAGSTMIVSTPREFFQQEFFESADEHHLSHWTAADFDSIGSCEYQNAEAGRIFVISPQPIDIRGFGRSPIKRLRRIARVIRDEL